LIFKEWRFSSIVIVDERKERMPIRRSVNIDAPLLTDYCRLPTDVILAHFERSEYMTKRWFWLGFAVLAVITSAFYAAAAKTEFFKIEELQPGMKGIGKTCFHGAKPEEFQVEILGVLRGVNPGASAVLAKFSGGLLDKIGIFEGMSGSPVYIDGKLLGAVAFSYSFAKEAIGGITPITQMVEAFSETGDPSSEIKIIANKSPIWNYRMPVSSSASKPRDLSVLASDIRQQSFSTSFDGHALIPIATPLSMGGFHSKTLKVFAPQFRAMGMSALQGIGAGSQGKAVSAGEFSGMPFEPGSNIVVSLVRGDLDVSAGGTVTYVEGNRLYAFGHSLLELGFTELPMQRANAITVFPSLESSFKILEPGEVVGAIRQDRGMGIYGIIGEKPRMAPIQVRLTTSRGIKKVFKYDVARDPFLTPVLVNLAVYNTIVSSERAQGAITLKVKGTINVKDESPVEVYNCFSSDSDAPALASRSIAVPVNYLMSAGYSNLDLQNIDLEISVQEKDLTAVLDSVRLDRSEIKAGESVDVEISWNKTNGEIIREIYPVKIPENASPGALTMLVADGESLMSLDEQEEGENLVPRDLSQLIRFINNLRKNDHLYVRFFRQEPGAVVKGEGLPGLPPSILSILKSDRKAGAIIPIRTSTLMEYELPATDYLVSGAKALKLLVKP
jgi:hypothetical protein